MPVLVVPDFSFHDNTTADLYILCLFTNWNVNLSCLLSKSLFILNLCYYESCNSTSYECKCVWFVLLCGRSHFSTRRHLRRVTIDDLINRSEYELFKKVGYPCHSIHHLLPPYRTSDLRNRGHLFQLPEYTTDLHKKSFIIRTLYKYV